MNKTSKTAVIAGGTGLIGSYLIPHLINNGYRVILLTRNPQKNTHHQNVEKFGWDGKSWSSLVEIFEKSDVVVNLAGHSIAKLWTKQNKKRILESRIYTTRAIAQAINACKNPPPVLVQASAVGIYPYSSKTILNENSPIGRGFLASVCKSWENEALTCAGHTRLIIIRTGVVLSSRGGFLPQIVNPIKYYIAVLLGDGTQTIPWIHIDDHIRAILFLIENPSASGAYNLTAPAHDSLKAIVLEAGKRLGKPIHIKIPAFLLNLLPGNMAKEVLLANQPVEPLKLKEQGFSWNYSTIEQALRNLL